MSKPHNVTGDALVVYSLGDSVCAVCVPKVSTKEQVETETNQRLPGATAWAVSAESFPAGRKGEPQPNPCPCDIDPDSRQHWLLHR